MTRRPRAKQLALLPLNRVRLTPHQRAVKALAARARRLGIARRVVAGKLGVSERQLYRYLHDNVKVPAPVGSLALAWSIRVAENGAISWHLVAS